MTFLHEFCAYEEDGIPGMRQVGGSEHTVLHQALTRLMCNELGIPLRPGEASPIKVRATGHIGQHKPASYKCKYDAGFLGRCVLRRDIFGGSARVRGMVSRRASAITHVVPHSASRDLV